MLLNQTSNRFVLGEVGWGHLPPSAPHHCHKKTDKQMLNW